MLSGRHATIGSVSFFVLLGLLLIGGIELSEVQVLASLVWSVLGSVFPDLDSKSSSVRKTARKAVLLVGLSVAVVNYWDLRIFLVSTAATAVVFAAMGIPKHRGFLHSLPAALLFSLFASAVSSALTGTSIPGLFAFLGYFSHLAADRKI